MRLILTKAGAVLLSLLLNSGLLIAQSNNLHFDFDQHVSSGAYAFSGERIAYTDGIDGQALVLNPDNGYDNLTLNLASLDGTKDFSVQCWIKTRSTKPTVFLSKKNFSNKGIVAQKNIGWVLYSSGGTFGWSVGSGDRRINYERDNGEKMPINDGEWHQITITYSKEQAEFRLYYDGQNAAIYNVGFDFANTEPLVIGAIENTANRDRKYSIDIETGRESLQAFVDEFNNVGLAPLKNDEFLDLIVDPEEVFNEKQKNRSETEKINKDSLSSTLEIRKALVSNPYTVFQNMELTTLKPVSKIYALEAGKVVINDSAAKTFTQNEKLYPADFAMDNLSIWQETISAAEVLKGYKKYIPIAIGTKMAKAVKSLDNLNVGVWNIWHGGIHWTLEKDGWDSRLRIVEMIQEKEIDVILMQETYSSGDFIAAELGYYFATTSDWDYRSQGANISVISRYPIKEVQVLAATEFNNVGVKLAISDTQEIWAMSNWYGMGNFTTVVDFHQARFAQPDKIPVLFGGDFNAVPHTDGGDSPASKILIDAGFMDAFRSQYLDVKQHPGFSHRSGVRIDQLYFKGEGLKNTFTETISTWPSGFPSDHYLIVSKFELDY